MNAITSSTPGYSALTTDLGRTPRRAATTPAEQTADTTVATATQKIEEANRSAALGSIDDFTGAQAAVAQMRLAFATQPTEARAAQGSPSPEKALRLLAS